MRRKLCALVPAAVVAALALGGLTAPLAAAAPAPHPVKGGVIAPTAPTPSSPKVPAVDANKALPGYVVVAATFTDVAGEQSLGEVLCPVGTTAIGGGAVIASSSLEENLNGSFPFKGNRRSWRAYVNNTSANNGSFTVYATCVKRVPGYAYVEGDAATVTAGEQAPATATCPDGTVPLGGGGYGNGTSTAIGLNSSYPTTFGWQVDVNNGSSGDDPAFAVAVCGTAPTGYKKVTGRQVVIRPQSQALADATCPSGLTVLSGGGYLSTSRITASLNSTVPNGNSGWRSYGNLTSAPRAYLTSYAICGRTTSTA